MKWEELVKAVVRWSDERGIPEHSSTEAQLLKAVSELGELCDAEIKGDYDGREDAIGDVLVCLIIYCDMWEVSIEECLERAYNEIKDRKGRIVPGGAFVKEE